MPILSAMDPTGKIQVSSVFFTVDGVDKALLHKNHLDKYPEETHKPQRYFEDVIRDAQIAGTFPCGRSRVSAFESVGGIWRINITQCVKQIDIGALQNLLRKNGVYLPE